MSETTKRDLEEAETGDESGAPLDIEEEQERSKDADADKRKPVGGA